MAQNVTIAGASYLGVPRIEMPKTGGGTAVFVDTSDANAAAGDITKGKTAYVGGTKITGTLEASSVSVQDTKAVTITSNGTVSVTPDAPYDALKKVDVTVNVASGGGTPSLQSKSVTYTSNGTATIIPDEGYDGLSSVDVTVDVASVSTVTINCEDTDTFAFWLSPDGVFHDIKLNTGANTIIVAMYSPIGVYNTYGYGLTNLKNIVDSGQYMYIRIDYTQSSRYYRIYYATAITASATQPTD